MFTLYFVFWNQKLINILFRYNCEFVLTIIVPIKFHWWKILRQLNLRPQISEAANNEAANNEAENNEASR